MFYKLRNWAQIGFSSSTAFREVLKKISDMHSRSASLLHSRLLRDGSGLAVVDGEQYSSFGSDDAFENLLIAEGSPPSFFFYFPLLQEGVGGKRNHLSLKHLRGGLPSAASLLIPYLNYRARGNEKRKFIFSHPSLSSRLRSQNAKYETAH